ncbi:hypothetical protein ACQ4PT_071610 [Festuca glaucescens]
MGLFARKMEKYAGRKKKPGGEEEKKAVWDWDYESFVDVSRRVMVGRSRAQQQEAVREVVEVEADGVKQRSGVLIKKCRYLENSGCVGMCVNMCKIPTQSFFTDEFGLPLTMNPSSISTPSAAICPKLQN